MLASGARLGPYEIISALGAGGMGEVYRARDTRLNRDVALKVLPDSFATDADRVARFTREAQTLAALNHPHIAQIYGIEEGQVGRVGQVGQVKAIVMELVEGETLADRISRGAIPLDEALPIARQIAEALERWRYAVCRLSGCAALSRRHHGRRTSASRSDVQGDPELARGRSTALGPSLTARALSRVALEDTSIPKRE